ncbi:MAG: hypothetical protein JWN71_2832 [Xanthobacteraceae bacterium]|jgi:hypothetical protein|nr:hypothetical protein [Xanthobacteraceae bacterium]
MKRRFHFLIWTAIGLSLSALAFGWLISSPYPTAEAALADFYGGEPRPECMQSAPLLAHGKSVAPLVTRALSDKTMQRRLYAIDFLGQVRSQEALPALEAILSDVTEIHGFRASALQSIYEISPPRGRELAARVENPNAQLNRVIEAIQYSDKRIKDMISQRECQW